MCVVIYQYVLNCSSQLRLITSSLHLHKQVVIKVLSDSDWVSLKNHSFLNLHRGGYLPYFLCFLRVCHCFQCQVWMWKTQKCPFRKVGLYYQEVAYFRVEESHLFLYLTQLDYQAIWPCRTNRAFRQHHHQKESQLLLWTFAFCYLAFSQIVPL